MKIHIEFMATLRREKDNPREFDIEVHEGASVREIIKEYFKQEELKMVQVIIDGIRVSLDHKVQKNDQLFITIPIGGG